MLMDEVLSRDRCSRRLILSTQHLDDITMGERTGQALSSFLAVIAAAAEGELDAVFDRST